MYLNISELACFSIGFIWNQLSYFDIIHYFLSGCVYSTLFVLSFQQVYNFFRSFNLWEFQFFPKCVSIRKNLLCRYANSYFIFFIFQNAYLYIKIFSTDTQALVFYFLFSEMRIYIKKFLLQIRFFSNNKFLTGSMRISCNIFSYRYPFSYHQFSCRLYAYLLQQFFPIDTLFQIIKFLAYFMRIFYNNFSLQIRFFKSLNLLQTLCVSSATFFPIDTLFNYKISRTSGTSLYNSDNFPSSVS